MTNSLLVRALPILAALTVPLFAAQAARAATISVTTTADSGSGSLRSGSLRAGSLRAVLMLVAALCVAGSRAQAATLAENTVGEVNTNPGFCAGQSVTTSGGGPFNRIRFNLFNAADNPTAAGTVFVLDQEYRGSAANLSSSTPGFVAQSSSIANGAYVFDDNVVLQGNTVYFFYTDTSPGSTRASLTNPYAGGILYGTTGSGTSTPFGPNAGADRAFRLTGDAAPDIDVQVPAGTSIASGATVDFGRAAVGSNKSLTFSIANQGSANLNITLSSNNAAFSTGLAATSITAGVGVGGSFTFRPTALGAQSGVIRIDNNDPDENPFLINVTGVGVETPSLIVNTTSDVVNDTDNVTSLREAINYANSNADANTITFAANVRGTIELTQIGEVVDGNNAFGLNGPVTIQGPGADVLNVRRVSGGDYRILRVANGVTASISGLTLSGGNIAGNSGGIMNSGNLTLSNCAISGNTTAGFGGGIRNSGNNTTRLVVQNCTISGNTANSAGSGGGIDSSASLQVSNSTISGNSAPNGNASSNGGGISSGNNSSATLTNCTLTDNSAAGAGSASGLFARSGTVTISNTIIAGNQNNTTLPDVRRIGGTVTSNGYNLIGNPDTVAFNNTGDRVGTASAPLDPKLAPLSLNAPGTTETHALQVGSPAANAGNTALTIDQRGVARPIGGADDIGAFESSFVPPVLSDVTVSTDEDTAFTFAANSFDQGFSDANSGDTLQSVRIDSLPANGVLNLDGNAVTLGQTIARADLPKLSFIPALNFNGQTGFNYNASDGGLFASKSARLTVNVAAVNDAPQNSVPGAQSTDEDTALTLSDPTQWSASGLSVDDVDSASLTLTLSVEHGTLMLSQTTGLTFTNGDGTSDATMTFSGAIADLNNALRGLRYDPTANFNGADTLTFKSSDGALSDQDTVAITVNAVNDAPTISAIGAQSTDEDSTTSAITVTVGDIDNAPADLIVTATSDNQNVVTDAGIVVGGSGANRTLTITPAANASGAATITVTVSDGALSANTSFVLTVNSVNDAPSFSVGANQTVNEDAGAQSVTNFITNISAGPSDESAQTLSFDVTNSNNALFSVQPTISATGTLSYTPTANANGSATVSVNLRDNGGTQNGGVDLSATQTFVITIASVNDAPVALADAYAVDQNTTLTVSAASGVLSNDSDIDSASLSAMLDTNVAHGTLTLNSDGSFSYLPTVGYRGSDSFSYHANDGQLKSDTVTVSLTVTATPQPINFGVSVTPKAPTTNDLLTATPVILDRKDVTFSYAWSVDGQVLPNETSATLDLSKPGNGDKGQRISVSVTATRGIDGGNATNFVTVQNSAPFAFSQSGAAQGGVAKSFVLRGADFDAETLTFKRVGGPSNGTATIASNADGTATLTYTGRADFGGVEVIRFVSIDESGRTSQPATLSISVTRVATTTPQPNRAPSANNITAFTRSGVLVKIALSGSDPDGDALTFKRVGGPTNGTGEIQRDSDGLFKMFYTPRVGFVGNEVIRFVALDTTGKPSAVATMTINVTGANSASGALQSAPSANNS